MGFKDRERADQSTAVVSRGGWLSGSRGGSVALPELAPPTERTRVRRRRTSGGLYDQLLNVGALLLVWAACAAMWYASAVFTLAWLEAKGLTMAQYGSLLWLIPLGISVGEIALLPFVRQQSVVKTVIWLLVVACDVWTTVAALAPWIRAQPEMAFLLTPQDRVTAAAVVIGTLFAIAPEPIARYMWHAR